MSLVTVRGTHRLHDRRDRLPNINAQLKAYRFQASICDDAYSRVTFSPCPVNLTGLHP